MGKWRRLNGNRKGPTLPTQDGQLGRLHLRAQRQGGGEIVHDGDYFFVGRLESGVLAFTPARDGDEYPIYLSDAEVVSFLGRP